jgi:hypothetical protein
VSLVLSSAWTWIEATERMKSRNAYENGGNGGDAEEEDER